MTVAYIFATVVLCGALLFSYFTMKRILIEQASLYAFGTSTNELSITIRDTSLYSSDLKAAKELPDSNSRLEEKIKIQMMTALERVSALKKETTARLLSLQDYSYYKDFHNMFNSPPDSIWHKLDQYVNRLHEIIIDNNYGTPGADLLWLPVEATAAKNGTLGKSYSAALERLQMIIAERSSHLDKTHKRLTFFSVIVVMLELLLIFYPLKRQLGKVNTRLLSAHKKLYNQANYDQQTGLPNTSGVIKQIHSQPSEQPYLYLLIVGIENTDTISRIVGPPSLDIFFTEFANRLHSVDSSDNLLFRAGDNEFGILLTHQTLSDDTATVSSIQKVLGSKLPVNNSIVYPKVRLGCSGTKITSENLLDKLIDARLAAQVYEAAEFRIPKYESYMRSSIEDENILVEKLRNGLTNREFVPYYQIKVDANTGYACGMEALCRWVQTDGTIVPPFEFIPVAEKSGIITEITWQLLEQIAIDYKAWISQGLNPGRIAFNAAESMLREINFLNRIKTILESTEASHCPLDLEITENVALGLESEAITKALSAARTLGMEIALDDFGTGYASLSSIVGLDVDIIKVDKSFVSKMSTSSDSRTVVVTIIHLCQQLNKKCVVEGVETREEWEFCRDLGCTEIQGYYFHRPAPFLDVQEALISEQRLGKTG